MRADRYLANSTTVRDRIKAAYGIDAAVVPPPHGVDASAFREPVPELVPWRTSGSASWSPACCRTRTSTRWSRRSPTSPTGSSSSATGRRSSGSGPGSARGCALVSSLTDAQLRWVYAHAVQLVAPSLEDFGLTPLEAAAFGRPTLALRAGGYLDTIVEGRTGLFFDRSDPGAIRRALDESGRTSWSTTALTDHAARFTAAPFAARLRDEVTLLTGPDL